MTNPNPSPELQPMSEAPKDGSYIVGYYRSIDNERTEHWNGRAFVIRHEGKTASDYDLGWALFPGYGGVPDICFAGWAPLPAALSQTPSPPSLSTDVQSAATGVHERDVSLEVAMPAPGEVPNRHAESQPQIGPSQDDLKAIWQMIPPAPGEVEATVAETVTVALPVPGEVERIAKWRTASVALGSWLSAALDDPNVCNAMKADINAWFSASEPFAALTPNATQTREAELQDEIERLRGLLISPGDPAWEDARAALVAELRKNGMDTHADNIAASYAVSIPSWIALNLIGHSRAAGGAK